MTAWGFLVQLLDYKLYTALKCAVASIIVLDVELSRLKFESTQHEINVNVTRMQAFNESAILLVMVLARQPMNRAVKQSRLPYSPSKELFLIVAAGPERAAGCRPCSCLSYPWQPHRTVSWIIMGSTVKARMIFFPILCRFIIGKLAYNAIWKVTNAVSSTVFAHSKKVLHEKKVKKPYILTDTLTIIFVCGYFICSIPSDLFYSSSYIVLVSHHLFPKEIGGAF